MLNTTTYTGTVIGPSYIYNYDNNSVTSLLDVNIDGNNYNTSLAVPEYLNKEINVAISPGYRVSFVVDVAAKVVGLDIIEMNSTTNTSFSLYPNNCPVCGTPLTRVVYYRGNNYPYIARVCFSRSCSAFMSNNILNMLRALQCEIDYKYMSSIIESAMNKNIITDVSAFFRLLLANPHELMIDKMNNQMLLDYQKIIKTKFKQDFKLIHILQILNVPLTEDLPLASQLCEIMPELISNLVPNTIPRFMEVLQNFIHNNHSSPVMNIAHSILTFLQVHKNAIVVDNLVSLIHAVATNEL